MKTDQKIRILLIEDKPDDAEKVIAALHQSDLEVEIRQVSSAVGYLDELESNRPHLILSKHLGNSDYEVYAALAVAQKESIPFIFISNSDDDPSAQAVICAFRHGATDYVLKDSLEDLVPAVKRAIEKRSLLLPICSSCKKIRDEKGEWCQIETFLKDHFGIRFTHSLCPEDFKRLMAEADQIQPPPPAS